MFGFDSLYLAEFAVSAGSSFYDYYKAEEQSYNSRIAAYQNIAAQQQLNYNAHLNLNEQEALELSKHNIDKVDIQKEVRREDAKFAAIRASQGGGAGQHGNSMASAHNNIMRHGYAALVRKESNYSTMQRDFQIRHQNLELQLSNKTNSILSSITSGGSVVGTGLQIFSAGVDSKIRQREGTFNNRAPGTVTGGTPAVGSTSPTISQITRG
jgi:hypothetical protein